MITKNPVSIELSESAVNLVKTIANIQHLSDSEVMKRALAIYKQYIRHVMGKAKMKERKEFIKFLRVKI